MKIIDIIREYHSMQHNLDDRINYDNLNGEENIQIFQYTRIINRLDRHPGEFCDLYFVNLTSTDYYIYISILRNKLLLSINELGNGLYDGKNIIFDLDDTDLELILKDPSGTLRMEVEDNEKYFRGHGKIY